jgi:hypothetical protein
MPPTWECVAWKTNGGYGLLGNGPGRENAARERIWFSAHCLTKQYLLPWEELAVGESGTTYDMARQAVEVSP